MFAKILLFSILFVPKMADVMKDLEGYLRDSGKRTLWSNHVHLIEKMTKLGYKFTDYIGGGTYGAVLRAVKGDGMVAIKFMDVEEEAECTNMGIIEQMDTAGAKYIIKILGKEYFPITKELTKSFCLLFLENGERSLVENMFYDEVKMRVDSSLVDKDANTKALGYVIHKLVEGFKTLNFDAGYVHGDIKPDNLVVVKHPTYGFEPRIIDFDLTFLYKTEKNDYGTTGKTTYVTYSMGYRAPELLFFCPGIECGRFLGDKNAFRKTYFMKYYRFDKEYKEDAWALGVSLKEIIQANRKYINTSDPFILFLSSKIISKLADDLIDTRMNVKTALAIIEEYIKANGLSFEIEQNGSYLKVPSKSHDLKIPTKPIANHYRNQSEGKLAEVLSGNRKDGNRTPGFYQKRENPLNNIGGHELRAREKTDIAPFTTQAEYDLNNPQEYKKNPALDQRIGRGDNALHRILQSPILTKLKAYPLHKELDHNAPKQLYGQQGYNRVNQQANVADQYQLGRFYVNEKAQLANHNNEQQNFGVHRQGGVYQNYDGIRVKNYLARI